MNATLHNQYFNTEQDYMWWLCTENSYFLNANVQSAAPCGSSYSDSELQCPLQALLRMQLSLNQALEEK